LFQVQDTLGCTILSAELAPSSNPARWLATSQTLANESYWQTDYPRNLFDAVEVSGETFGTKEANGSCEIRETSAAVSGILPPTEEDAWQNISRSDA